MHDLEGMCITCPHCTVQIFTPLTNWAEGSGRTSCGPGRGEGRTGRIAGALSQATQASKREVGESTSILWVDPSSSTLRKFSPLLLFLILNP